MSATAPKVSPTTRPDLKAVKKKICIRKQDVGQCRLCLRIQKRSEIRATRGVTADLCRKIEDAVAVRITRHDKLTTVCVNCLRMVDIIYNFRSACSKTNVIHSAKLVMLHEGKWCSEENKQILVECQELARKHRHEMDQLYKCTGIGVGNLQNYAEEEESVLLKSEADHVPEPEFEEIDDSDPETTVKCAEKVDYVAPALPKGRLPNPHYICEVCGKNVPKANEEFHRNKHANVKPYDCKETDSCGWSFHSRVALDRHIKLNHIRQRPVFECDVCQKHIRGLSSFRIHRRRHDDATVATVPCTVCGRRYRQQYIQDHMNTHTGELKYECEQCGKKYAAKNNWATHRKKCLQKVIELDAYEEEVEDEEAVEAAAQEEELWMETEEIVW